MVRKVYSILNKKSAVIIKDFKKIYTESNKEMALMNVCEQEGIEVQRGIFGADMKVSLINDGPVTIILEK